MAANNPDILTTGPRLRDAVLLVVSIGLFFALFLGSRPLSAPDEGRYVEISREMVETGDWLTPRLNGVKYFEKPPLFYWFEAFLIKLFGLSEWSVRTGPALFALFGCLMVYYAGARLFSRTAGILSAVVLATSLLFFALSRLISPDMPVSVLLTASLLSFLLGTREPAGSARRLFFRGFYAFAALATLTKGLIGVVFPGMIILTWMLVTKERRVLGSMHLPSGLALFLLIAATWHIIVGRANPEFLDFYFVREHFQRYLTAVHHHEKPFWFYAPMLLLSLFPWGAFLVQAVKQNLPASWNDRGRHRDAIFLMIWAGLIFLFFSASSSKLIPYLLPVLPPLALLLGKYLADAWDGLPARHFSAGVIAFGVMAAAFLLFVAVVLHRRPELVPEAFSPFKAVLAAILLGSIALTGAAFRMIGPRGAITAIAGTMVLALVIFDSAAHHLDPRSLKPMALALKPLLRPGDEVAHYRNYFQDLTVYLERRAIVVEWKGELAFGSTIEDTSGWIISEAELWKRWRGPGRIFLVASLKDAEAIRNTPGRPLFPVAQNKNTVILSNVELKR